MEKLVGIVAEKAGITESQARIAVNTVVSFLKDRLPPAIAGKLEAYLNDDASGAGGLTGKIGGMFNKKK